MKTLALAKVATNPELERLISKKDEELKSLARKNGKHYASKNQPAPSGDKLPPYVGDIKTGYEQLATEAHRFLQPGTHLPEGQLEADRVREKSSKIENQIFDLEEKNKQDEYELHNLDSKNVWNRIFWAGLITGIIFIGEIVFNAKAFEFSGENMLFALILSISVSFTVFAASHIIPLLYKEMKTPLKRRLMVIGVLISAIIFFSALAVLRSIFLAQNQVSISPVYFVIINLTLFIVSVFISYILLPTKEEIKGSYHNMKIHKMINKRKKEIEELHKEYEELKIYIMEMAKQIVRINYYMEYTNKRIEKMYHEAVEILKSTNLTFRTDRKVPDCFHDELPYGDFKHLIAIPHLNNNQQ